MIKVQDGGFILIFEDEEQSVLSGYEGGDAVLDLSGYGNLTTIDRKAFLSCKILRKLILPASIDSIGDWAFSKCTNLQSVNFVRATGDNMFGKGVFEGCDNLTEISFADSDKGMARLLALTTNRMSNDYLLRSSDLGKKTWYDKWDISLMSVLKLDSNNLEADFATGGEEDLPFVGVGMVDGEMPDEGVDFFKGIEKNKCLLAYIRLMYDANLSDGMREFLCEFIRDRAFGCSPAYAFNTLNEECGGDIEYYKIYMDVVKPDKDTINRMAQSLNATLIQAKAFLIEQAAGGEESSFFDDMML